MQLAVQKPRLEVADIFRAHGDAFLEGNITTTEQRKALRQITDCRTAALGGHLDVCDSCGHTRISYNSCRDRHCPKCQNLKKAEWLAQRKERLLPIHYFHVVFTLPHLLNALILRNRSRLFNLLFKVAAETLNTIARDPRYLGAKIGFTAILHTWGQNLHFHPHLHCVVTGGGIALDGSRWIPTRENYLFPVKVLGRLFRGKFLAELRTLYVAGHLDLDGACKHLENPDAWKDLLDRLYDVDWVVYSKPPFGGPEQVFQYLGRYTHRVAISNHRLIEMTDDEVAFRYRDYRDDGRNKVLRLKLHEFIRRFLLHILPKGFVKIRHYGILAGRNVDTLLKRSREFLAKDQPSPTEAGLSVPEAPPLGSLPWPERFLALTGVDILACPACGTGRLVPRGEIPRARIAALRVPILNSS